MRRYPERPSGRRKRLVRLLRAHMRSLRRIDAARDEALTAIAAAKSPSVAPSRKLDGMKAIASFLGVSERTAREYAARDRDPLPVEGNGRRWAYAGAVIAWARRHGLPVFVAA